MQGVSMFDMTSVLVDTEPPPPLKKMFLHVAAYI